MALFERLRARLMTTWNLLQYSSKSSFYDQVPPAIPKFMGIKARLRLRQPIPEPIPSSELEESFICGWGKGGQNVNKRANAVRLKHLPTGIIIKCHDERLLEMNRKIARKMLLEKLDVLINGACSLVAIRNERKIRRKRSKSSPKRPELSDSDKELIHEHDTDEVISK